jgi:hypothetical protein
VSCEKALKEEDVCYGQLISRKVKAKAKEKKHRSKYPNVPVITQPTALTFCDWNTAFTSVHCL